MDDIKYTKITSKVKIDPELEKAIALIDPEALREYLEEDVKIALQTMIQEDIDAQIKKILYGEDADGKANEPTSISLSDFKAWSAKWPSPRFRNIFCSTLERRGKWISLLVYFLLYGRPKKMKSRLKKNYKKWPMDNWQLLFKDWDLNTYSSISIGLKMELYPTDGNSTKTLTYYFVI